MKIKITGSNGFVGKNLIPYLKIRGVSAVGVSRNHLSKINSEMLNGFSSIVHLAGKAHDLSKSYDPSVYYEINTNLTKNLFDAFLKSDADKFIFISSVKAAADSVNGILDEDVNPQPKTDYGKSKLLAESYIQNRVLPMGKSFYILRPCMIHGPGNKGNLNLLYRFVSKNIPYPLAAFENKRSFLGIENLCFVINELVKRDDIPSGIYNVSDDEALSTNEVVIILATSLNKKPLLWQIAPGFINFMARLGDKFHLPLTSERLRKLTENYVVSNMKLKRALDKPLPVSSKLGLETTALSFKNL